MGWNPAWEVVDMAALAVWAGNWNSHRNSYAKVKMPSGPVRRTLPFIGRSPAECFNRRLCIRSRGCVALLPGLQFIRHVFLDVIGTMRTLHKHKKLFF
ncbi:MAG: hypothetical protein I8H91_02525 [Burkholderiales bacterium]|nr:hypothetical protein [Burkholderiales bacterium]